MRGSLPTRVARPGPSSRLARFGALASVTLLVSLTASTAVALADDTSPGLPGGVSTTLASLPTGDPTTTAVAPTTSEPPPTTEAPTTTEAPPTTDAPTTTEAPTTTTSVEEPTTTTTEKPGEPPVPTTIVVGGTHPGFSSDCRRDDHSDHDGDKDEHGQANRRRCSPPQAIEPIPDPPVDPRPTDPITPGGSVTQPPSGSSDDVPGVDDDAPDPVERTPIAAADPGTSSGGTPPAGDDDGVGVENDGDTDAGDDEFAIAAFGDTELRDGVDLALEGRIGEAPPFSERLWAALPFGLLVGVVLVGMAVVAVRLTRDDLAG